MKKKITIKRNKVLDAGIGYTIGNYLLKGINFLSMPLFTRVMSTQDYGIYSTYLTFDAILAIIIGLALHSSLKNAKYRYKEGFDAYFSSILILPLVFLTLLLAVVNLFPAPFVALLDLNRGILNILLVHSFANSIIQMYNNRLSLDYNYQEFLKISFFNTGMNLLLSLVLMYTIFQNERYAGRILGSALPMLIIAVFIFWKAFRKKRPRPNREYWRFALNYSLPIVPHGLSQVVLSSFDKIMIRRIIGDSQAGIYSLGINIEGLVQVTTASLDTVWEPWFYERMEEKDYKTIRRYATYYAYGIFVLACCLMMAAPEVVRIMGSPKYQDARYVVIPLMNCMYFTFLYTFPATVEYYYQKTKMIALGTMGAAVLNVVLNSICIPNFGYQAAAYTTLVSYAAYFVFHYCIAKKVAGFQLFNTRAISGFIIGTFCVNVFSLVCIDRFWVRLTVGLAFLGCCVFAAYKRIYPEFIRNKEEKQHD